LSKENRILKAFNQSISILDLLLIISLLHVLSCGDTPTDPSPESPIFHITSITFTGDSTGTGFIAMSRNSSTRSMELEDGKGEPYTEVTLEWSILDVDSVLCYCVYRAEEPGIQSGSVSCTTAGTTTDTILVDDESLVWGDTYYYAIKAYDTDSIAYWSDEVSIAMPNYQLPTPSLLSAEDLPLGMCQLSWTLCPDTDFESYTLLTSFYGGMYNPDTLAIITFASDTTFSDLQPIPYSPRYYQIVTTDTQGLSSESNVLEYSSGYGMPWIVDFEYCTNEPVPLLVASDDENFVYFFSGFVSPESWRLNRVNTITGDHISPQYVGINGLGNFALDFDKTSNHLLIQFYDFYYNSTRISIRDPVSLDNLSAGSISQRTKAILALPDGDRALLAEYYANMSYVIDLTTFELMDTLSYCFDCGQHIDDYIYILGSGPIRRIDPQTLEVVATSPLSPAAPYSVPLMISSSGSLCCYFESNFYMMNPSNLTVESSLSLPFDPYSTGIVVEIRDSLYTYVKEDMTGDVIVYNMESGEYVGQVVTDPPWSSCYEWPSIYLQSNEQIWFMFCYSYQFGIYRISSS
jgi:hypothetical protein